MSEWESERVSEGLIIQEMEQGPNPSNAVMAMVVSVVVGVRTDESGHIFIRQQTQGRDQIQPPRER